MKYFGFFLLIMCFVTIIALVNLSPGVSTPFRDQTGNVILTSIAEIERVDINGISQFMYHRAADESKPILLFLHGGPGVPEGIFFNKHLPELEKHFIVCQWDQRGAGNSQVDDLSPNELTIDNLISDTEKVSQHLLKKFNKKKLFLVGHSWGSYLAFATAHKSPQLFHAVVGTGQVTDVSLNEQVSFDWVLQKAKDQQNQSDIKTLQSIGPPVNGKYGDGTLFDLGKERNLVMKYGGAAFDQGYFDIIKFFVSGLVTAKEYTLTEKIKFINGGTASFDALWPELIERPLMNETTQFQLPVYIIQGLYDYQTPYPLAQTYFEQIEAPVKHFSTYEKSAHNLPFGQESERFAKELIEISLQVLTE